MPKQSYDLLAFLEILRSIAKDRKVPGRTRLAAADRMAHLAHFYTVELKAQEDDDLLKKFKEKQEGGKNVA